MNPHALMVSSDLLFASRITELARARGLRVDLVTDAATALERAAEGHMRLLVLDLTCPAAEPASLLPALRRLPYSLTVVAYGPHVAAGRLEAAAEAGCDLVLTRGQFDRQASELLEQYLGQ